MDKLVEEYNFRQLTKTYTIFATLQHIYVDGVTGERVSFVVITVILLQKICSKC